MDEDDDDDDEVGDDRENIPLLLPLLPIKEEDPGLPNPEADSHVRRLP
jgi:hypothetical protein